MITALVRRLLFPSIFCMLLPSLVSADLWDDARKATRADIAFQDAAGNTIRGTVNFQSGQSQANVTLFRGNAQVGGPCGSFNLGASLKDAFETIPDLLQTAGEAVLQELPLLVLCYSAPSVCDIFKHYSSLISALVQARYASCQQIQTAMSYGGMRLRGGAVSQCLEEQANTGAPLSQAMATCNGRVDALRRPDGTTGIEANLIKDTLAAAGASTESQTLAHSLLGEVTLRAGGNQLTAQSERPQAALLAQYAERRVAAEQRLRDAVQEYRDTGTLSPATQQGLSVPGQPLPRVVLDALVTLDSDPVRRDVYVGKLATGVALTQLVWDCHQLSDELQAAIQANNHLTDEARRLLEAKHTALRQNLAEVLQKVEVMEKQYQPAIDTLLREYTAVQQQATSVGLRAPAVTVPSMPYRTQTPMGYGR